MFTFRRANLRPAMSFNSRYKPGWTLAECALHGVKTLTITCLNVACGHEKLVVIGDLKTRGGNAVRQNIPVNHMSWACEKCRHDYVKVTAMREDKSAVDIGPVFDVTGLRPSRRRPLSVGRG